MTYGGYNQRYIMCDLEHDWDSKWSWQKLIILTDVINFMCVKQEKCTKLCFIRFVDDNRKLLYMIKYDTNYFLHKIGMF